jgi:hypothetical protein
MVFGRWSLVVGRWSLVVGRWSLVVEEAIGMPGQHVGFCSQFVRNVLGSRRAGVEFFGMMRVFPRRPETTA